MITNKKFKDFFNKNIAAFIIARARCSRQRGVINSINTYDTLPYFYGVSLITLLLIP